MRDKVYLFNDLNYKHSTQYFVVYLNNITDDMVAAILNSLSTLSYFVGYSDFTYKSFFKDVISMSIGQQFLLHDGNALQVSIDGAYEDVNNTIFDFDKTQIKIINLDEFQYNSFLRFKIKRNYYEMDKKDQLFSINSVYHGVDDINGYNLIIDDKKFEYLCDKKNGSMTKIGGTNISKSELEKQIISNINTNYMFNLDYNNYGCLKFNTDLEFYDEVKKENFRCIASFEIVIPEKQIRLITLY